MRKLIIGCGYLGQRVARLWIKQGHDVFALTRSTDRSDKFRQEGIEPIVGDILQPETLQFPENIETCLYAIALDRSSGHSKREVYCTGVANVLDSKSFVPKHLIYISSTSVYGVDDGSEIDETTPTESASENGQICLDAENMARSYSRGQQNVLRLSGIYGPNRLIARTAQLQNREPITGNPRGWLNLIHVDDAARAVLQCETNGSDGELYLISDDRPIERQVYYSSLAKLVDAPEPVFEKTSDALGKRCVNEKVKQQLELTLRYPTIEIGLAHAIE